MSGKSDVLEYGLLQLIFNGVATNFSPGATAGSTLIWVGLHTADPTDAGSTANEGGYAAYTRIPTVRSTASTGWAVSSGTGAALPVASPVSLLSFPAVATTSTGTFTFASFWSSSNVSSTGMLYYGPLTPNINFGSGVTPQITTGSSITEE